MSLSLNDWVVCVAVLGIVSVVFFWKFFLDDED